MYSYSLYLWTLLSCQLSLLTGQSLISSSDLSNMLPLLLPSALIVAGVHAFKPEFTPFAITIAGVLTAYALFTSVSSNSLSTNLLIV